MSPNLAFKLLYVVQLNLRLVCTGSTQRPLSFRQDICDGLRAARDFLCPIHIYSLHVLIVCACRCPTKPILPPHLRPLPSLCNAVSRILHPSSFILEATSYRSLSKSNHPKHTEVTVCPGAPESKLPWETAGFQLSQEIFSHARILSR